MTHPGFSVALPAALLIVLSGCSSSEAQISDNPADNPQVGVGPQINSPPVPGELGVVPVGAVTPPTVAPNPAVVPSAPAVSEQNPADPNLPAVPNAPPPDVPGVLPPEAPQAPVCDATIAPRLRRLSPKQFDNTVRTFIPGVDDSPSNGFLGSLTQTNRFLGAAGELNMSAGQVDQVLDVTEALGIKLAAQPEFLAPCMAANAPDAACVNEFTSELLTRAFRRPPADDLQKYVDFYSASSAEFGHQNAIELITRRVLVSPDFLFRFELGGPDGTLSPHELASSLSYFISNGPPDAELMAAADDGALMQPDVLRAHAERLLDSRDTGEGLEAFFEQNFPYNDVRGSNKNDELFPAFNDNLANAMADETREFIANVLWQDDAKLGTLLSAPYSMLNQTVASLYGVEGMGEDFVRVELPPEQRGGIITQPSFLALNSTDVRTDIVHRGLFISEEMLCINVPSVPENIADVVVNVDYDAQLTQRDILAQHSSDPSCAACHALFDTLALPLEQLDAIGTFRTEDKGLTIDPVVAPLTLDSQTINNPGELARAVAADPKSGACFAKHFQDYIFGDEHAGATCEAQALTAALQASDGSIRDAVLQAVLMPSFRQRTTAEVNQ